MHIFPSDSLAEKIVLKLQQGPLRSTALIEQLQRSHTKLTRQGVYKALRTLRASGIVLLHKKEASINQVWLTQLENFTLLAQHAYRNPAFGSGHFLHMRDGDKIAYEFKNPVQVDIFWNHVLYVLLDAFQSTTDWLAYSSHCWFLIVRQSDELALMQYMTKRNIKYLFTVGHNTPLDKSIASIFDGTHTQYYMRSQPLFEHRPNHLGLVLNIFGDYVIEAIYDKTTTKRIEAFYQNNTILNDKSRHELADIVASPSKIKFSISKNSKKAQKLKQQLKKHFY